MYSILGWKMVDRMGLFPVHLPAECTETRFGIANDVSSSVNVFY